MSRPNGDCLPWLADYERHLREPSRKVRDDVEREWSLKVSKLEDQLESKRIWANRLDENVRAVSAENKDLQTVSISLLIEMIFFSSITDVHGFSGVKRPRIKSS